MENHRHYAGHLSEEAQAFDRQIFERVQNGHIPDLERVGRNEWFRENVWRDQAYANLLYGNILVQMVDACSRYIRKDRSDVRVLELGCGPGHLSLGMARSGFRVTGLDISAACIEVARSTAAHYPELSEDRLKYIQSSVEDHGDVDLYDLVFFSCSLHHFSDLSAIFHKIKSMLSPEGIIYVSEPTRLPLKAHELMVVHLLRGALAAGGHYHGNMKYPESQDELDGALQKIQLEFDYVDEDGNNLQSPHDNEVGFEDMYTALKSEFDEIDFGFDFSFFDRIVGGIRLNDVEREREVARWIALVDRALCRQGFTPEQFHFIGRPKSSEHC